MTRRQHDYEVLEREYIESDISVRQLCLNHGITAWSSVNVQKRKLKWDEKRAAYKEQLASRQIDTLVGARLKLVAEIHGELLLAMRHAIRRFIADVSKTDNAQSVSARDLQGLIDKFLLLTGQATSRTENHGTLDLDFGGLLAGAPPELLQGLADLARQGGAGARPVGSGPLVVIEGTRAS